MQKIKLTNCDAYVLVDNDDYERLNSYNWAKAKGYARRYHSPRKYVLMHREILTCPRGFEIDHIDGDKLNNSKSNLRVVTHAQNMQNRKVVSTSKSGYKGVCWDKKAETWQIRVWKNGKYVFRANRKNLQAAVKLYNDKAIEHFGQFARLNKI